MNISKTKIDDLNAVVKIEIEGKDYESKVDSVLNNYRKKANIPGFRKGNVPLGIIKKQYQKAVIADEVNKLVSENLEKYIKKEKIELLGSPWLPWTCKAQWRATPRRLRTCTSW